MLTWARITYRRPPQTGNGSMALSLNKPKLDNLASDIW